jgi:hypothetical protein
MGMDRSSWPTMVRLGLWGLNRETAWMCFWLAIVMGVGCVGYGFFDNRTLVGGLFVLAAPWYYLSIQWVDRHGAWQ